MMGLHLEPCLAGGGGPSALMSEQPADITPATTNIANTNPNDLLIGASILI
jgi:hypothetical protein